MAERTIVAVPASALLGVLSLCAALASCTEAHDVDALALGLGDAGADEADGDAGSAGSAGSSGGSAGAGNAGSGTGGSAGTAGSGGRAPAGQPVFDDVSSCAPCMGSDGMSGALEACCTADGACGLDISPFSGGAPQCVPQNAPGVESSACPAYTFGGTFALTSCCSEDGLCGVFIMQTAPLGCVDPALLGDLVSPAGMMGGGSMFGGGGNRGSGERARCNAPVD